MNNGKKYRTKLSLPQAIGDWMTYKPVIDTGSKRSTSKGSPKLTEKELVRSNYMLLRMMDRHLKALEKNADFVASVDSASLELLNYTDILKGINLPVVQFKLSAENIETAYLCTDMSTINAIISCAVGGPISEKGSVKALTEIEENIICSSVASSVSDLFADIKQVKAELMNYPRMYFDQNINNNAVFGLFEAEISFGQDGKGIIMIILPVKTISGLLKTDSERKPKIQIERLPQGIKSSILCSVSADLGKASISANELYELSEGDVILLDKPLNSLVELTVGPSMTVTAQPGTKNGNLALQIVSSPSGHIQRINNGTGLSTEENLLQDLSNSGIFEEEHKAF